MTYLQKVFAPQFGSLRSQIKLILPFVILLYCAINLKMQSCQKWSFVEPKIMISNFTTCVNQFTFVHDIQIPISGGLQYTKNSPEHNGKGSFTNCPIIPPNLFGPMAIHLDPISEAEIVLINRNLKPCGRYQPLDCIANHKVAVIIPFRNREEHSSMYAIII